MSTESGDRDYESCPTDDEHGEKVDDEKRKKEEEENKKAKERQSFLGNLYVLVCMIIIGNTSKYNSSPVTWRGFYRGPNLSNKNTF